MNIRTLSLPAVPFRLEVGIRALPEPFMQPAVRGSTLPFEPTYAALALTTLLWSSNFVIGRALRDDVSPSTINFLRWAIALLILVPVTLNDLRTHRAALVQHWKLIVLLGLTGIAAFQTLTYFALTKTTAMNTILLLSLAPFAIVALSRIALGERINRNQAMGLVASLVGAVVLILHGDLTTLLELRFNAGDVLMLLAVVIWAVYSVLLKRRPAALPPLAVHTTSVAAGTLCMLPSFGWEALHGSVLPASFGAWAAIVFIAVFSSALAHGLWVRGVAKIGPNRAGVFIHLMPLFGGALAIVFLDEHLALYHAIGAALVLGGVVLTSRSPLPSVQAPRATPCAPTPVGRPAA
jgi:drug/metabolite transporter (DMT)-like permease